MKNAKITANNNEKLRQIIWEMGLTISHAARLLGMSSGYLGKYVTSNGRQPVRRIPDCKLEYFMYRLMMAQEVMNEEKEEC